MIGRPNFLIPSVFLFNSTIMMVVFAMAPSANHPVAAVFPPWWTAARAFAAASAVGVPVLRLGVAPGVFVLGAGPSDIPARLRAAGAFLVLDANALGGCLSNDPETKP